MTFFRLFRYFYTLIPPILRNHNHIKFLSLMCLPLPSSNKDNKFSKLKKLSDEDKQHGHTQLSVRPELYFITNISGAWGVILFLLLWALFIFKPRYRESIHIYITYIDLPANLFHYCDNERNIWYSRINHVSDTDKIALRSTFVFIPSCMRKLYPGCDGTSLPLLYSSWVLWLVPVPLLNVCPYLCCPSVLQ